MVDFINDPEDILEAFKAYYETAELADVTDPHLVYDLRNSKTAGEAQDELNAFCHYWSLVESGKALTFPR